MIVPGLETLQLLRERLRHCHSKRSDVIPLGRNKICERQRHSVAIELRLSRRYDPLRNSLSATAATPLGVLQFDAILPASRLKESHSRHQMMLHPIEQLLGLRSDLFGLGAALPNAPEVIEVNPIYIGSHLLKLNLQLPNAQKSRPHDLLLRPINLRSLQLLLAAALHLQPFAQMLLLGI